MGGRLPLLEGGRKAAESCDVSLHERQRTGSCPLSQYICTQGSDSAGGVWHKHCTLDWWGAIYDCLPSPCSCTVVCDFVCTYDCPVNLNHPFSLFSLNPYKHPPPPFLASTLSIAIICQRSLYEECEGGVLQRIRE